MRRKEDRKRENGEKETNQVHASGIILKKGSVACRPNSWGGGNTPRGEYKQRVTGMCKTATPTKASTRRILRGGLRARSEKKRPPP